MLDKSKIIQDISLLYELSLAVGSSLDLHENCEKFLTLLMARKRVAVASVWVNDPSDNTCGLAFASPSARVYKKDVLHDTDYILGRLVNKPFFKMDASEADYPKIVQEKDVEGAAYVIYRLKEFGFLKMTTFKEGGFSDMELNQLLNVVKKFAVSIEGAMSHRELFLETERRIRAQEAEKQFLATMSHEIRNPMHAVIGTIQVLSNTDLNPVQEEHLTSLTYSSNLLLNLLDNILDLSKIEAGELTFEEKKFDLKYLVSSVLRIYENKIRDKDIRLLVDDSDAFPNYVIGDPTRLNQVLINLMSNAVKFTKHGEVGVGVRVMRRDDDVLYCAFTVRDTGLGIAPEKIDVIFDKFKQAESGMNRRFGGTGLGLAIVKELVGLMGGEIHVKSEVGKGTEVVFQLPLKDSGESISNIQFSNTAESRKDLNGMKVLVVEDDEFNQRIISIMLKNWGCVFDIAGNGKIGLELSRDNQYDLVLMDIHMPVMNGIESTHGIRTESQNPNRSIPIIAMTASALQEERRRAFEAGMNAYVTKPFTSDKLKAEVQLILDEVAG